MLKAYFFATDEWEGYGDIIIADTEKEALRFARKQCECDYDFLDYNKHIHPINANLTGIIQKGKYERTDFDMVRRGMYAWCEGVCPICGENKRLSLQDSGRVCCDECEGKGEVTR
jgi:hypothetical protein